MVVRTDKRLIHARCGGSSWTDTPGMVATARQEPRAAGASRMSRPILGHGSDDPAPRRPGGRTGAAHAPEPLIVAPRWATADEAVSFLSGRPHAARALWARGVLTGAEPALRERVARGWGALTLHHPVAGYVAGVFTYPARAFVVWEHGVELYDPEGLLEGDGTQVRTLTIASCDASTAQALEAFLSQALALRA